MLCTSINASSSRVCGLHAPCASVSVARWVPRQISVAPFASLTASGEKLTIRCVHRAGKASPSAEAAVGVGHGDWNPQ